MNTAPKWRWLRKPELDLLFAARGLEASQRQWLERAVQNYGIVTNREADPRVDLFRLPVPLSGSWACRWIARAENIDWTTFGICTPVSGRHGIFNYEPTPIDASAERLAALLGEPAEKERKKPGPPPVVVERTKAQMRNDITAGRFTLADLEGMTDEALRSQYGDVSRTTARRALSELVSELAR